MKTLIAIVFSLSFVFVIKGQNSRLELSELGVFSSENFGQAKVYFNQETLLKDIIISKTHVSKDRQIWRIRIFMSSAKNARAAATSTRNSFVAKYPDVGADIVYPSPHWKVLVGNFKTRIEAESFRKKIMDEYSNSRVEMTVISKE